ncbi:MAG TPA: hypothetical protein GX520_05520, partial [Syntrophaceticus sp.]|nr:hypothetical protein [Syntrophaceticus sp.]
MAGAKEQIQYEKQINYLKDALRRSRDLRERALSQKELLEQQRENPVLCCFLVELFPLLLQQFFLAQSPLP